jgi:DNA-binding NarL/FixJ family response regulator
VDDFEPWRRFVSSFVKCEPNWQVVGEASDGVEAVQKAEELQPDLIFLDVGLPKLNGIEAARQIRKIAPRSKMIFLSQVTSSDVVQKAIRSGALGYVSKVRAATDVMKAIDAVLECKLFISTERSANLYTERQAAD